MSMSEKVSVLRSRNGAIVQTDEYKYQGLRKMMVDRLRDSGIRDELVLSAMAFVPRQFFIDATFGEFAYRDMPFSIGCEQTISQPATVARQSELLEVKQGLHVLEIGTGSGYQAAVLDKMGAKVFTVERIKLLYMKSKEVLRQLAPFVECFHGDGSLGLPQHAPFDRIVVTAAAPSIPQNILAQLNVGGIMVVPVNNGIIPKKGEPEQQTMMKIIKTSETQYEQQDCGMFSFVPLINSVN